MNKKKILIFFGTRPELIKIYPLYLTLKKKFSTRLVFTSQHDKLIENIFINFGLKKNQIITLKKNKNSNLNNFLSSTLPLINNILDKEKPDFTIIQGDTSTTFVTALSCFLKQISFGHLEAGLRTHNKYNPFPEEKFRQMISSIADLHFCPTKKNYLNLISEGIDKDKIFITGNTVIDGLINIKKNLKIRKIISNSILITLHRRESFLNYPDKIIDILKDLIFLNPSFKFEIILHENPLVKKTLLKLKKFNFNNLKFSQSLDYYNFIKLIHDKDLIISDSGGIQEECFTLNKPLIIFRENTERVEGLKYNFIKLSNPLKNDLNNDFKIMFKKIIKDKISFPKINPYGDGKASTKILKILKKNL